MTEMSVERLYSTLIPGEEGLVALTVIFKDPETGEEWPEHYPRVRVGDLGAGADGQHRYTLTTLQPGGQQWEFREASEWGQDDKGRRHEGLESDYRKRDDA